LAKAQALRRTLADESSARRQVAVDAIRVGDDPMVQVEAGFELAWAFGGRQGGGRGIEGVLVGNVLS